MTRRNMLYTGAAAFTGIPQLMSHTGAAPWLEALAAASAPQPPACRAEWRSTWVAALAVLAANVRTTPSCTLPVLFEGSTYRGIWQEDGPHESLVYASLREYLLYTEGMPQPLDVARNSHLIFFSRQREDGQLPASVKMEENGFGQIQMVVPIAATAYELAQELNDEEFLRTAYLACCRWDAWLRMYRDTRKTGLIEGFCTYDTGHDNSPRWKGIPNRCPNADARECPPLDSMPRICPDLSATVYGARVALHKMAWALGKREEADRWLNDAEAIRELIIDRLYSPEDAAFYDLDAHNKFVRVRSDVISRVLGEHVLKLDEQRDRAIFDSVWERQLYNPKAFWGTYPLTSIAMDDPVFVRPIPRNSWGGAAQALTALRAPRWMGFYGKHDALLQMMEKWCEAIARHREFRQQLDPVTGNFTQPDPGAYSPTALLFLDFSRRLATQSEPHLGNIPRR